MEDDLVGEIREMVVLVVVESEDDGDAGGGDLADLGDDAVDQHCGGEVVHQVEQTEAGLVPPVRQGAGAGGDEVVGVQELVVDEAVRLDSLRELVCLTEERHRLVAALSQQSNLLVIILINH